MQTPEYKMPQHLKVKAKRLGFGEIANVIFSAKVSHVGHESDNYIWIVETDKNQRLCLTTSHLSVIICTEEYLIQKITETSDILQGLKTCLINCVK